MSVPLQFVDQEQFFAPANEDAIDVLLDEYAAQKRRLEHISDFISGPDMQQAARFFFEAQKARFHRYVPSMASIFDFEPASKALDAYF